MVPVAVYCRVSTDKEDQVNSFESQQSYFREYIARNSQWTLFDVYADEGITGTSTQKRIQFNRMIRDAYEHKFQLIITKEVSRFSRNILDTIAYTRELKALGIGVIFMSDGFGTLEPDAELRLSIMGSIAQEESRKTSARVKWGQTRQMEKGVVFGRSMLGYDVERGKLSVNPEGAEIVRQIFHMYGVRKKGIRAIAKELRQRGYRTYTGNLQWNESYILKILKNEKYVGDLVQKKTITPDYLTHAKKYNHGEEELINIQNHHEPIISRELWKMVQEEIAQRNRKKNSSSRHSNRHIFSGKIICAQCGSRFISRTKTRKDGSSYRRWACYRATRDGVLHDDRQGNPMGCDIGKQIRDDLAMDMLTYVIRNLELDLPSLIQNVATVSRNAIKRFGNATENQEMLQKQIERIQCKRMHAVDSFLSGMISPEELKQIRKKYETELDVLNNRLKTAADNAKSDMDQTAEGLYGRVERMMFCHEISDIFLKSLLEYMKVYQDGTVEIKLNQLSTIWKFLLYKG